MMQGRFHTVIWWAMMVAYLSLLAHAFVPHHHHHHPGSGAAFLNHLDCPHDDHTHETEGKHAADQSPGCSNSMASCETINHARLEQFNSDDSHVERVSLMTGVNTLPGYHLFAPAWIHTSVGKVPWFSPPLPRRLGNCLGLRGPPTSLPIQSRA